MENVEIRSLDGYKLCDEVARQEIELLKQSGGSTGTDNGIGRPGTGENAEIFNDYNDNVASGEYSHAEGMASKAIGKASHAEGFMTNAEQRGAHSEGEFTFASALASHAEGVITHARGNYSHAEGSAANAIGANSHAEGVDTVAEGEASHAEGRYTDARGNCSHSEGEYTHAINTSHTEGKFTYASDTSHAEGEYTVAMNGSHAEGRGDFKLYRFTGEANATVYQIDSTEGLYVGMPFVLPYSGQENGLIEPGTIVTVVAFDKNTKEVTMSQTLSSTALNSARITEAIIKGRATGEVSHVEGYRNIADGNYSHAEGKITIASGEASHTEGRSTAATGLSSHAEGEGAMALNDFAHAEGNWSTAAGQAAHAEGWINYATGAYSHAEGSGNNALGSGSHAEGELTIAFDSASHAEGQSSCAGDKSHAEGQSSFAVQRSHAEGQLTYAANTSHAQGQATAAFGLSSHAEGVGEIYGYILSGTENSTLYTTNRTDKMYIGMPVYTMPTHADETGKSAAPEFAYIESFDTNNLTVTLTSPLSFEGSHQGQVLAFVSGLASAKASHAEGLCNIAMQEAQHVQGKYNVLNDSGDQYAHIVGNGASHTGRSNAHTLDWSGNAWFSGDVYTGSTSGTNKDEGSKKLATEDYINSKIIYSETEPSLVEGAIWLKPKE